MLYLVGGASRAGKSMLARKLLMQRHIPYFSIDILMMGLANGFPEFGLDPEDSGVVRGEKLWPILRAMCVNILEEKLYHPTYLLEGDSLLPKHVAELIRTYGTEVKACFIGYTEVVPVEKLRDIRMFESAWANSHTGAQALAFIADQMGFSVYLQQECATHNLRFCDCSVDLPKALDDAFHYLVPT